MEMSNDELQSRIDSYPAQFLSLNLATVDQKNNPNASYAPFIQSKTKDFYVYLSSLAKHTHNLYHTKKASIMLIQDETTAEQIFARKRLTYQCQSTLLDRQDAEWTDAADQFEIKFGEIYQFLRSLPDFRMFRLTPYEGLYVEGFGQAYPLDKRGHVLQPEIRSDAPNPHRIEHPLDDSGREDAV